MLFQNVSICITTEPEIRLKNSRKPVVAGQFCVSLLPLLYKLVLLYYSANASQ